MKLFMRIVMMSSLILCITKMQAMSYGPVFMDEQDLRAPNDNPAYPYPFIYPQYWDDTVHIHPMRCKKEKKYYKQRQEEQTKVFIQRRNAGR